MTTIKLYGAPNSTCTARAMVCLEENGVPYELVPVNLPAGEHKRPDYLSRNPFGQIPAMEDGDLKIFESRAISKHIARKFASSRGPNLLRLDSPEESTMVDVWMEVEAQSYSSPVSALVFQIIIVPFFSGVPDEKAIEANAAALAKVLDVYEERLSQSKYLAGDFYSLADQHHLPYTYYLMTTSKAYLINSRPHVMAWWEDISSRPAFRKVAAGMDLHG